MKKPRSGRFVLLTSRERMTNLITHVLCSSGHQRWVFCFSTEHQDVDALTSYVYDISATGITEHLYPDFYLRPCQGLLYNDFNWFPQPSINRSPRQGLCWLRILLFLILYVVTAFSICNTTCANIGKSRAKNEDCNYRVHRVVAASFDMLTSRQLLIRVKF